MVAGDNGPAAGASLAKPRPWWHVRRGLSLAFVLSIAIHLAISLVPDELPPTPEPVPLQATLQELPPPPLPSIVPTPAPSKPKPKPKPRRTPAAPPPPTSSVAAAPEPAPPAAVPAPEPAPAAAAIEEPPQPEPEREPPAPVLAEDVEPPADLVEHKVLPPRVDLAYKVFYGTQGFLIGRATYRFEHADNRYRIGIIGDAKGLAALLYRGQGRVESRGVITADGLQPHELVVDKFNRRGSERAEFDWENGIANLHDNKTAPLEVPTYDLLALMWQFYFQPPESDVQTFALATTKRVFKVTATRKRRETLQWSHGAIETELWHRTSMDGRTEGYVWLAPSLRYLPIKMRAETPRGTVEVLLDQIRVDAEYAEGVPASAMTGELDASAPAPQPATSQPDYQQMVP
jgi:hypothetical protein